MNKNDSSAKVKSVAAPMPVMWQFETEFDELGHVDKTPSESFHSITATGAFHLRRDARTGSRLNHLSLRSCG